MMGVPIMRYKHVIEQLGHLGVSPARHLHRRGLRLLADALDLSTAEEVLDVAGVVFGDRLDPAARFFVEELPAF